MNPPVFPHHLRATATAPSAAANRASAPGSVARSGVAELLPGLVAPRTSSMPEWPYDVASMDGSMKMVLTVRVWAVVGYVTVDAGETALSASLVRKTSAKPGAGTGTAQVLAVVSHCTVVTFRSPTSRPSEPKFSPSVCGISTTVRLHTARRTKKELVLGPPR